jgi:putative sigma-54 modulation protein
MKLTISFKHLDHTPALDQRIQEKSEKFEKYFQGHTSIQWFCWVQGNNHWAEVKVHGPKFDFFAKGCADNMYKSLDIAVEKMERQIEKQKDIKRNKMHSHQFETPKYTEIQKCIDEEEEFAQLEYERKTA